MENPGKPHGFPSQLPATTARLHKGSPLGSRIHDFIPRVRCSHPNHNELKTWSWIVHIYIYDYICLCVLVENIARNLLYPSSEWLNKGISSIYQPSEHYFFCKIYTFEVERAPFSLVIIYLNLSATGTELTIINTSQIKRVFGAWFPIRTTWNFCWN